MQTEKSGYVTAASLIHLPQRLYLFLKKLRKSLNRSYPISQTFATASSRYMEEKNTFKERWQIKSTEMEGRLASSLHSRSKTVTGETFFLKRYFLH